MTLAERARLATEVRQRTVDERARRYRSFLDSGMQVKRAAYYAGISLRTASRYRRRNV